MALRKFTFDRSFDAPKELKKPAEEVAIVEEEAPPPPPVVYSEEELQHAKQAGFAEGFAEGEKQAMASVERMRVELLQVLGQQLQALQENFITTTKGFTTDAVAVGMTVVKTIFPHLVGEHKQAELKAMLDTCFQQISSSQDRLLIKVHEEDQGWMRSLAEELADHHGYKGEIKVRAVDDLQTGDCLLEWENGGAERITQDVWAQLETLEQRLKI